MLKDVLNQLIASGIMALVFAFVFYFLIPKLIVKAIKNNPDKLDGWSNELEKIKAEKAEFDFDPNNEDLVERLLRYATISVSAAKQKLDDKNKEKTAQNAERLVYAKKLVSDMLIDYKTKMSMDPKLTEVENDLIEGMIEAAVSKQKAGEI